MNTAPVCRGRVGRPLQPRGHRDLTPVVACELADDVEASAPVAADRDDVALSDVEGEFGVPGLAGPIHRRQDERVDHAATAHPRRHVDADQRGRVDRRHPFKIVRLARTPREHEDRADVRAVEDRAEPCLVGSGCAALGSDTLL